MRTLEMFIGGSVALIALFLLLQQGSGQAIQSLAGGSSTIIKSLQGRG